MREWEDPIPTTRQKAWHSGFCGKREGERVGKEEGVEREESNRGGGK